MSSRKLNFDEETKQFIALYTNIKGEEIEKIFTRQPADKQVIMVVVWGFGRFRNFSQKPPHTLCGFPPAGELPPVLLEALVNSGTSGGACAGLLAMVPKWVLW